MGRPLDESVGDLLVAMGQVSRENQGPEAFVIGTVTVGSQEGL